MFILASKSPRRIELLKSVGLNFRIETAQVDEAKILYENKHQPHQQQVLAIAQAKAKAVFERHQGREKVLAGDTLVVVDDEILGKPVDEADAKRMLVALTGKSHHVYTAISLIDADQETSFVSTSKVTFRDYNQDVEAIIDASIANKSALGKAGAYGIQETGSLLVTHIEGDYYAIMGLPLAKTYQLLVEKGWI